MAELEASIAAAAAAQGRGRARARGRARGSGRGRGRPPLAGGSTGGRVGTGNRASFGVTSLLFDSAPAGGSRHRRSVSFASEYDEDFLGDSDDNAAGKSAARVSKRQVAKHLQRMLENRGQWDAPKGGAQPAVPAALPAEAWDALAQTAPEEAQVTCAAVDLASSIRYFAGASEISSQGESGNSSIVEAGTLAHCSVMLAAASGLVDCQDALTKTERERLGLENPVSLPEPTLLSNIAPQQPGDPNNEPFAPAMAVQSGVQAVPPAVQQTVQQLPLQVPNMTMPPQMGTVPLPGGVAWQMQMPMPVPPSVAGMQISAGGMPVPVPVPPQFMGMGLPGNMNMNQMHPMAFAMLQHQMGQGNGPTG